MVEYHTRPNEEQDYKLSSQKEELFSFQQLVFTFEYENTLNTTVELNHIQKCIQFMS